jgi:hypothetical protein
MVVTPLAENGHPCGPGMPGDGAVSFYRDIQPLPEPQPCNSPIVASLTKCRILKRYPPPPLLTNSPIVVFTTPRLVGFNRINRSQDSPIAGFTTPGRNLALSDTAPHPLASAGGFLLPTVATAAPQRRQCPPPRADLPPGRCYCRHTLPNQRAILIPSLHPAQPTYGAPNKALAGTAPARATPVVGESP